MKTVKSALLIIPIVGIVIFLIYGFYWAGKNISYNFFYESLVKETINETVKQSCLIKQ